MTIRDLNIKLNGKGISEDQYFLHGLFGSKDDNEKIALTIRKGQYGIEYKTYYKERGDKNSSRFFSNEKDACEFIYKKLMNEQAFNRIQRIDGLLGMTVNERLWESGLMDEFDQVKRKDKMRAKEILRWLSVDEPTIEKMLV